LGTDRRAFEKAPSQEPDADVKRRLPVRLPLGVSPKIGMSASEWKPIKELGKTERTDRPEASLNLFEQPLKMSFSAS
jgi:hypothetical protein